jgi:PAS domain-containing protein
MDEVQFNASLDALLAGESMNVDEGGSPGANNYPMLNSQSAHGWLTSSTSSSASGRAGMMSHAMNPPQPTDPGTTSLPAHQNAHNTNHSASLPPTNYFPSYLSYGGSNGTHSLSAGKSVTSSGDAISVSSSRSGGRTTRSAGKSGRGTSSTAAGKHGRDASAVSEDEGERHRRREDRNAREQQRSQKITEQIEHLRDVLVSANVQFKPDKYSTLVTAAEYIQELQHRSAMLDVEHKKLVDTISRTNEMVNEQYIPASTTGANPPGTASLEGISSGGLAESDALYLSSIDYKSIFEKCGVPLAVLSIDGRFLECNEMFERLTGFTRDELLPTQRAEADKACTSSHEVTTSDDSALAPPAPRNMSLFNLLGREHMERVFLAMSEMLRQTPDEVMAESDSTVNKDFWSGEVALTPNMQLQVR